jgi:hypothetical protein
MFHSSSVVESHSVQSQFASLTDERDKLLLEMEALDRERRRIDVTGMRELQVTLGTEIHKAHSALGIFTKKRDMLQQETRRLQTILQNERSELEQTQADWTILYAQEKQAQIDFVSDMQGWNDHLELLIQKQEEEFLSSMLASVEGITVVKEIAVKLNLETFVMPLDEASSMLQEALQKQNEEKQREVIIGQQLDMWRARVLVSNPVSLPLKTMFL